MFLRISSKYTQHLLHLKTEVLKCCIAGIFGVLSDTTLVHSINREYNGSTKFNSLIIMMCVDLDRNNRLLKVWSVWLRSAGLIYDLIFV